MNVIRAFDAFVDDLSNWYIRRSRRRFYGDDPAAFRTLWYALVAVAAGDRAGDAVPRRPPLVEARSRPRGLGPPRRLARGRRPRSGPACGDRRGSLGRRARPAGALDVRPQAAPAAAPADRRGRAARGGSCRRDRRRAARQDRRVRRGRGLGAEGEAEPAGARPEARQGPAADPHASRRRLVHRARRRALPGRRPHPRAGRGDRRAHRPRGLGRRHRRRGHGRRSTRRSTTSSASRPASTT